MSSPRTPPPIARRTVLAGATFACGFVGVFGQEPKDEPPISLTRLNGERLIGSRITIDDEALTLDGRPRRWEEALDVSIGGPVAADAERGWVELTGGDRLFGDATDFDGEEIAVRRPDGTRLRLPADRVRFVRFANAGP
ncbi:MAG: hypothetical protein AAF907_16520, partial [Planctomycetota bacterium]